MSDLEIIVLNEATQELGAPQVGDRYLAPRAMHLQAALTTDSTIDGRDVAADGALAQSAIQPGDNISTLINDLLASQAEAEAGVENTKTMTPLRVAQAIAVLAAGIQNEYSAIVDPTTADDNVSGYAPGSYWINTVTSEVYRCIDATTNLAVWVITTLSSDDVAAVALSGDSDDLTEGAVHLLLTTVERAKLGFVTVTQAVNLDTMESDIATLQLSRTVTTGITAFATGGQASATELSEGTNVIAIVATDGDSVKLPTAVAGLRVCLINRGASHMDLFPGVNDSLMHYAANIAVPVSPNGSITLQAVNDTNWILV